jgi:hypothetical protein
VVWGREREIRVILQQKNRYAPKARTFLNLQRKVKKIFDFDVNRPSVKYTLEKLYRFLD